MFKVFYSWQANLPGAANRNFIEKALEQACKQITAKNGIDFEAVLDRDVVGVAGATDIRESLLNKISDADVFVADVTPINSATSSDKLAPNPNVLFETGYAAAKLGNDALILVLNEHYGKPEQLPFDLRGLKILTYRASPEDEDKATSRNALVKLLLKEIEGVGHIRRNDPVLELVYPRTLRVARISEELLKVLISEAKKPYDFKAITESELDDVCAEVNPNGPAPIVNMGSSGLEKLNWLAYLLFSRQRSKQATSDVLVFGPVLEPQFVALLVAIEQGDYFGQLDLLIGRSNLTNQDLSSFALSMWKYILAARKLREYAEKIIARRAADL